MLARIIIGLALAVFSAGFIYFAAQVIYLGIKEFFRIHGKDTGKAEKGSN